LNGQFVPESQAKVSVMDRGFRWGDGVYETLRTFQGKLFKLNQHLERLHGALLYSRINLGQTMNELGTVLERVVEENARY
jgi:branched-subunit amino acid aminotransferase/4-amino-4-deoxychorismate lyase